MGGILRGAHAEVMGSMIGSESILHRAAEMGKDREWVKKGDKIIGVHGLVEGAPGRTNLLKVLTVE